MKHCAPPLDEQRVREIVREALSRRDFEARLARDRMQRELRLPCEPLPRTSQTDGGRDV